MRFGVGPIAGHVDPAVRENASRVISKAIRMSFEIIVGKSYSDLLASLRNDDVQLAWLPPALCVRALETGSTLLLGCVRDSGKVYHGALFVPAQSTHQRIADTRGLRIGWVDRESCSGYLFPRAALVAAGIDPKTHFAEEIMLGSHSAVVQAVAGGHVHCGATFLNGASGNSPTQSGWGVEIGEGTMRTLLVSKAIPSDAICASDRAGRDIREHVSKIFFRELHRQPEGADVLRRFFNVRQLEPALPRHYDVVREAMELVPLSQNVLLSRARRSLPPSKN